MKNKFKFSIIKASLVLSLFPSFSKSINTEARIKSNYFSCGTENFESIPASSSIFETNTWTNNNITWTASDSRTDQTINNRAIVVRNGNLSSSLINGGIKSLTVTTQLKFTGTPGTLILEINNVQVGTIPFNSNSITTTIENIDIAGDFVLKIVNPNTGQRIAIDDLSWTCYSTLAVNEISNKNSQFLIYPNPIRNGEYLHFNKIVKEIIIYNSDGKLIKRSNVKGNSVLIDNLANGIYFINIEYYINKFTVK